MRDLRELEDDRDHIQWAHDLIQPREVETDYEDSRTESND